MANFDLKNKNISLAMKETRSKRKNQVCRVYKVKIDESRLSILQAEQLKMLFVEAKWLVNDCIAWSEKEGNSVFNYKISKNITKKNKDFEDEQVELKHISAQMMQSVISEIQSNVRTLASLKKRNKQQPGKLKYRKEVKSINLKQHGATYSIFPSNSKIQINVQDRFQLSSWNMN